MADSKRARTEKTQVSCYPEEDDLLQEAADRMGIPKATYTRLGALEKARREKKQLNADRNAARRQAA